MEGSRRVARELAERHGVDGDRVDLAVAAHDLARALKPDALLAQARRLNHAVHPVEARTPLLLHGPVAARWLETEDGVDDEEVLDAVRYHTTGREGMSELAKVVFLADKLDPQKVNHKGHMERVAALATDGSGRRAAGVPGCRAHVSPGPRRPHPPALSRASQRTHRGCPPSLGHR